MTVDEESRVSTNSDDLGAPLTVQLRNESGVCWLASDSRSVVEIVISNSLSGRIPSEMDLATSGGESAVGRNGGDSAQRVGLVYDVQVREILPKNPRVVL